MCSLCVPLSVGLVPALRQGVVHVFVVCALVCWTCAGITSACVYCVCPSLHVELVLTLYVRGSSYVRCVSLSWTCAEITSGGSYSSCVCFPVCWTCAVRFGSS